MPLVGVAGISSTTFVKDIGICRVAAHSAAIAQRRRLHSMSAKHECPPKTNVVLPVRRWVWARYHADIEPLASTDSCSLDLAFSWR